MNKNNKYLLIFSKFGLTFLKDSPAQSGVFGDCSQLERRVPRMFYSYFKQKLTNERRQNRYSVTIQ